MILSSAAQMLNGSGGSGLPWLPNGATAFLDFVNGHYYAGGASQAVGALLGAGFDPDAISGSGMLISFANGNLPKAIGDLLTDIAAALPAGCTVLLDMDFINEPYGFVMFIGDNTNWNTSSDGITIAADDTTYDAHTLNIGTALTGTGVHKLALTLNRDVGGGNYEYAWCADGAAALTTTKAYAASWTVDSVWIGSDGVDADQQLDTVYIRSITLYPALDPADLPALTA